MRLPVVMMRDILLKTMFRKNLDLVGDIAEAICLPRAVTQELVDLARSQKLIEATGTLHANSGGEMGFQLTDAGKARALDALSQSEYFGAMPVPLDVYSEQVGRQSIRNIQITREQLTSAMGHLVLPPSLLDHLGPAVSAGRSILMYGPPGNGKSSISNGIRDAMGDKIYVPRAIEYAGQVITVYDPIVHSAAEVEVDDPGSLRRRRTFDTRYVRCERPTVITGGELSLSMLDLVYNPTARTYQAPLQLKSTGGIFIVDDLGLVFQLMGSTCGALIMFILPAATYLRCKQRAIKVATSDVSASPSASKLLQVLGGERFGDDALVAWAILAFGCWVAVYNVASVAVARLQ